MLLMGIACVGQEAQAYGRGELQVLASGVLMGITCVGQEAQAYDRVELQVLASGVLNGHYLCGPGGPGLWPRRTASSSERCFKWALLVWARRPTLMAASN